MNYLVEDLKIANDNLYSANKMLEKEIEKLHSIIKEAKEYINEDKNCIPKHIKDYFNNLLDKENKE